MRERGNYHLYLALAGAHPPKKPQGRPTSSPPEITMRSSYGFVLPPARKVTRNLPGDPSRRRKPERGTPA